VQLIVARDLAAIVSFEMRERARSALKSKDTR